MCAEGSNRPKGRETTKNLLWNMLQSFTPFLDQSQSHFTLLILP
jgi:hypothetical protein